MRILTYTMLVALWMTTAAGCNQQDAECLSRIGRKVSVHTKNSAGDVGAKLDVGWFGAKKEPTLQEKIHDRLRWEKSLTEFKLEVIVKDKEVELKGQVKSPEQRQRAIELAETLIGVEKVTDSLTVRDADEAAK